jgi:hypothetical protein
MLPAFDWNGGPLQLESLAGIVGIRRHAGRPFFVFEHADRVLRLLRA